MNAHTMVRQQLQLQLQLQIDFILWYIFKYYDTILHNTFFQQEKNNNFTYNTNAFILQAGGVGKFS